MYNYIFRFQTVAVIVLCVLICGDYAQNDDVQVTTIIESSQPTSAATEFASTTTGKPPKNICKYAHIHI